MPEQERLSGSSVTSVTVIRNFRVLLPAHPVQTCLTANACTRRDPAGKRSPAIGPSIKVTLERDPRRDGSRSTGRLWIQRFGYRGRGARALHGTVNGGRQPVSGSSIQLYAAGTSGPGSAAQPLLSNPVQSDSDGNFSIPASYLCPSATAQVYVVARGGNPGLPSGAGNPALELTAMLGSCSDLSDSIPSSVNEVTTVGSVWPLAAFMTSSSNLGSALGDTSFLTAVSSVPEFINIAQGNSPGKPTATSYFAENSKLYSLADVLANCVNSTGGSAGDGSPCGLFSRSPRPQAEVHPQTR